jgi:class 3 adenylate cyclase/tetratricopeptide (TPR) repeat protein
VNCPACGAGNRTDARFCDSCGAPLAPAVEEHRKVVSVLFCDVVGSTALGEAIDPEALQGLLARYFERMRAIVERYGGSVEKFVGDAVIAVFGVPAAHEDDALRACRAAVEMRDALPALGIQGRIGLNTGEVVTGTEERLATGNAINVAARLQQAAQPGELLVGEATLALVRGAASVEPVEPLALKGKAAPVRAFRLLRVTETPGPRRQARFVGRGRELTLLREAWARTCSEQRCQLLTIVGEAGVGKSRLVAEALALLDARVVEGRCLPYGDGVTYWPVLEVLRQLDTLPSEPAAAALLGSLLGASEWPTSAEELAWAFRKALEEQAPLVVVFDDIHSGEETFLELLEGVALLSSGAPILLLCMARPELLDRRPSWPVTLQLEPLAEAQVQELIGEQVPAELGKRIARKAGGNPLFVLEMLAVAAGADGRVVVPPTLKALLAARLDQLDPADRRILERAAVEGEVFHRGALQALAPEETQLTPRLAALVRRELIRPERAQLAGEDGFRFRHLLVRDAAYEALSKATRAELHERFAAWLEERGAELVELDEVLGYHLERAYRYRAELGRLEETVMGIAARASEHLIDAAERARERGDLAAALGLLRRASDLLPEDDPGRRAVQLDLAAVLIARGSFEEANALLDELTVSAEAAGDERIRARVELARLELTLQTDPAQSFESSLGAAQKAAAVLEQLADDEGVLSAERLIGMLSFWIGNLAEAERLWSRALERAARTSPRLSVELQAWIAIPFWAGPVPSDEGIRRCDEMLARKAGSLKLEAVALVMRGNLKALRGSFDEARSDVAAGRALLSDIGEYVMWAGSAMHAGDVDLYAGQPTAAAAVLLEGDEVLRRHAEIGYLSTVLGLRAEAALELGQDDEALRLSDETKELAQPDDFDPQIRERCVRAVVLARRGEFAVADEALRQAEQIAAPTDFLRLKALVAMKRAEVASLAGDVAEEREALAEALALAEQKGDLVTAGRARARLAVLR